MSETVENTAYLKYRARFTYFGKLNIAAMITMIALAIVLLFVPMFSIDLIIATEWFSIFDEASLIFKGKIGFGALECIFCGVILLFVIVSGSVTTIKMLLAISDPDTFTLVNYDFLKKRFTVTKRRGSGILAANGLFAFLIMAMLFVLIGLVLNKFVLNDSDIGGYFALCTGVNGLIAIAVILTAVYVTIAIIKSFILNGIMSEIIKEEYDGKTQQDNAVTAADNCNDGIADPVFTDTVKDDTNTDIKNT